MSVFWHRKRSSCWPLPQLSVLVSSTLCRIVSLIPGTGVRFPFLSSTGFVAKTQDPSSLAPRFEGFTVPALPNTRNNRNGRLCPVRAVRHYLDRTAAHCPRCERFLSPQGIARRRYRRPLSPSGSGRQYHGPTSSRVRNGLFLPLELVRLVVLLRLFFSRRTFLSTRC